MCIDFVFRIIIYFYGKQDKNIYLENDFTVYINTEIAEEYINSLSFNYQDSVVLHHSLKMNDRDIVSFKKLFHWQLYLDIFSSRLVFII